ncbi:MAG: VanZ family protein [Acetobacteraceae bacterium]|nr:VanZ family protein [Acetobacteraceae bacterium]
MTTSSAPRRAYVAVLALTVAFILYGSLFPFAWYERPGSALAHLLGTWQDWDHRGDLLANIVLYVPFGFFLVAAAAPHRPAATRLLIAVAAGSALACGVELTQYHDFGRTTSMGDVYANAIGSAAGAVAAVLFGASIRWPLVKEAAAHPAPALLVVMWAGSDLFPYVPTIDMHKYWHAVRPLLDLPVLPLTDVLAALAVWAFLGFIVLSLYGFRRFLLLFPLLVAAEALAKVLILDNALTHANLLAAVMAYGGWIVLHRRPGRVVLLTLGVAAVVLHQRLSPFDFSGPPTPFAWLPFHDLMTDAEGPAVPLFCQKFFLIGGLVWLLGRCGMPLPVATALTALVLFGTGWAQTRIPGHSGEATDAVMALALGTVFMLLRAIAAPRRDAMAVELAPLAPSPVPVGRRYAPYVPPHLR